jgi:hypothetical protein
LSSLDLFFATAHLRQFLFLGHFVASKGNGRQQRFRKKYTLLQWQSQKLLLNFFNRDYKAILRLRAPFARNLRQVALELRR